MSTLVIEDGTKEIKPREYANCEYDVIIIPDSVIQIGDEAFKDSPNLKTVILSNNLKLMGDSAFENCESLTNIDIPESLTYLSRLCFANCHNLKTLNVHDNMQYFDHLALINCVSLTDFNLPKNITSVGTKAMFNCKSIKSIRVPASLNNIECGAFAGIDNLEEITVDSGNERYASLDCISLIDIKNSAFLQFAPASKTKEYKIDYHPVMYDEIKSREPIYNIADYAFANAKNLEKLTLSAAVESFGAGTFEGSNITELNILYHMYSKNLILSVIPNFIESSVPFKIIKIEEGIESLNTDTEKLFSNVEELILPNTLQQIGSKVFTRAKKLKELNIPASVENILENAFHDDMILHFEDIGDIPSKDFISLHSKRRDTQEHSTKIYLLKDETYKVVINDFEPITITKDDIRKFSTNSEALVNDPDLFINYFMKLEFLHSRHTDVFFKAINDPHIYDTLQTFFENFDDIERITNEKIKELISSLLTIDTRFNETLLNGYLMKHVSKKNISLIINNYTPELERFLAITNYLELLNRQKMYDPKYYDFEYIVNYTNLLHKYNVKDGMFYNVYFAFNLSPKNQELLITHQNKNVKRLLMTSGCLDSSTSLNDLVNLINILGGFSEDQILSQKVLTFITEKLFNENFSKRLTADRVHRVFNELEVRDEINYEFIEFFIDNYRELFDIEKQKSGFIASVYNEFEGISSCSIADNVGGRHLKVTTQKCLFYLLRPFNNITDDNRDLAALLGKYYFEDEILTKAEEIMNESKNARRNIFNDSMDEKDDLKYVFDDGFSYEWLPKQAMENLVLGKQCNCCAHVHGNGAGITYASMVDNDVQNLVIRDDNGYIIAKSTFYVNRDAGYGIFNNVETNDDFYESDLKKKIYDIFIKGVLDMIEVYNENNNVPLTEVHIGTNQNQILAELSEHHHVANNLRNIDYSKYAYKIKDKMYGEYKGDANLSQLCLYKK